MSGNYGIALLLTAIAGLSTGIGSLLGIVVRPGPRFMGASLGFAAGIMILISFVELLAKAVEVIGFVNAHIAFFGGMLFMFAIDVLVPHIYMAESETHETPLPDEDARATAAHPADQQTATARPAAPAGTLSNRNSAARMRRTSMLLVVGIGIHNFPEGMATFVGALQDVHLGVAMAVAIAVHNIPEGLAVAAPIYAATGKRSRAFLYSLLSGIAEPIGAAVGALILLPFLSAPVLAYVLAAVGGLMVFVSLDELVPASKEYGHEHLTILSTMGGMAVMALSLWLLL
ncbi:MAG: zinc transporter ZupT [Candidatus Eisenbacteria bacterium]